MDVEGEEAIFFTLIYPFFLIHTIIMHRHRFLPQHTHVCDGQGDQDVISGYQAEASKC